MKLPLTLSIATIVFAISMQAILIGLERQLSSGPPLMLAKNENQRLVNRKFANFIERIQLLGVYLPKKKGFNLANNKKQILHSIVEPKNQISDFEARFEFAKILSHHKQEWKEALRQYAILQKEKPNDSRLLLEISRLYIAQGEFLKALYILSSLLGKTPIDSNVLIERTSHPNLKEVGSEQLSQISTASSSIVPLEGQINNFTARLELARLLSHSDSNLDDAIMQYQILLQEKPYDVVVILEISRIYIRQKKFAIALSLLSSAIHDNPNHVNLLVEASHAEQGLDHPKQSQEFLLRALPLSQKKEPILMDYANTLMMVGSFYKAEDIYREALKKDPHSLDLALKLAWTLVSAKRYEEAEGLYRKLLFHHPNQAKILESLATLKVLEKDFNAALDIIENLLISFSEEPSYIQLKANTLYKSENFQAALKTFDDLEIYPKYSTQALIGKGKTLQALGRFEESEEVFQKAYEQDPSLIETQYYQASNQVKNQGFIQQIIYSTTKPQDLLQWANLYIEHGMAGIQEFFEAALEIDPDYFPAQIGLAEALSTNYNYDDALDIYFSILKSFPENSKIMIAIARIYSWEKEYKVSLTWYDQVIALNPRDPAPRVEKGRVAYWGKWIDLSLRTYQELLDPPVDQLLLETLKARNSESCPLFFSNHLMLLAQSVGNGSIYTGYENFSSQLNEFCDCEFQEKSQIEEILIDYLPQYRIQKAVKLESDAKALDWQNYFLHALPIYQELVDFSPGNEEGLYGYAQDFCNLGLCHHSRQIYDHILYLDPNHNLVKMALKRNLMREHLLLQSNYTYWREQGSGQFSQSQIARQQFDECVEWSPSCNDHFRFMQNIWVEYPFFTKKYYPAEGQTLEVEHTFNGYVKGLASATRKNYFQKFPSRYTYLGTLWFNLYDFVNLGFGFERRNEIYNYFTLKQGIQAKVYWLSVKANSHSWTTATTYRHLDYNDSNTVDHYNLMISYAFTDSPTIFKMICNANYLNAAHLTRIIVNPFGQMINVIHPYWTPDNYYSGGVTLEFRYNYAYFEYCEAPQRYFDIKLTGEDDTAHNPSIQLAINWKHEFIHWGFEITGLFHRSRLWNADGIWAQAYYRF